MQTPGIKVKSHPAKPFGFLCSLEGLLENTHCAQRDFSYSSSPRSSSCQIQSLAPFLAKKPAKIKTAKTFNRSVPILANANFQGPKRFLFLILILLFFLHEKRARDFYATELERSRERSSRAKKKEKSPFTLALFFFYNSRLWSLAGKFARRRSEPSDWSAVAGI